MPAFQIKLYGLSDKDKSSLSSLLNLAKGQLSHEWIIVTDGAADLSIYSFDSEEGSQAWQRHGDGASALLSANLTTTEAIDFVLKKPLRSKNFSTALNELAIKLNGGGEEETPEPELETKKSSIKRVKIKAKSPSLLSSLSKRFTTKSKPATDLPALNFPLPESGELESELDTILNPKDLQSWLSEITDTNIGTMINAIIESLIPLNRAEMPSNKRLVLLELYRKPIHNLLFDRDPRYIGQEPASHAEYIQAIHALNLLIKELCTGYQLIVNEAYQKGERPQSNAHYLRAIYRLAQTTNLSILHAYHYYLSPPTEAVASLHQLYIYCEASNTLHTSVSAQKDSTTHSFSHIYNQVMLMSIADPYRLSQNEILALYTLMGRYANKISITPLSNNDNEAPSSGYFYLDCSGKRLPVPLVSVAAENRQAPQVRLLNTEPVLKAIEVDLRSESLPELNHKIKTPNLSFLKKVTPQLNASYARQFERIPSVNDNQVTLALGIPTITQGLNTGNTSQSSQWSVHNRGLGGMMVSCQDMDCFQLNVGDFIGVFEDDKAPSLAIIRWLHTNEKITRMGLESLSGTPKPVTVTNSTSGESLALLLSNAKNLQFEDTLIVDHSIYQVSQGLKLKENDDIYKVTTGRLIEKSANYEQFSFKLQSTS